MNTLFMEHLDSTNTFLHSNWASLDDKTCVYCNTQSAGRGRLNRPWLSARPGNLYLSMLFKPTQPGYPYANLTQYGCVVLCRVLQNYGVTPGIKWPNDVLVNAKKIAGILAQTITCCNTIHGLVLGLGVNLNSTQSDIEEIESLGKTATSLNILLGAPVSRDEFLHAFLKNFMSQYNEFTEQGFPVIHQEYLKLAAFLHKEVTVQMFDTQLTGIAKTINNIGELVVQPLHSEQAHLICKQSQAQCTAAVENNVLFTSMLSGETEPVQRNEDSKSATPDEITLNMGEIV